MAEGGGKTQRAVHRGDKMATEVQGEGGPGAVDFLPDPEQGGVYVCLHT